MGNLRRNKSMTKPERFRPRQGMLNRAPSTKYRDEQRQLQEHPLEHQQPPSSTTSSPFHGPDNRFDSTGNLLENGARPLTGVFTSANAEASDRPASFASIPHSVQEQQRQERLRRQQAQQKRNQQQAEQQRIALERGRTIAGRGGGHGSGGPGRGEGRPRANTPNRSNTLNRANSMLQRANSKAQQGKAAIKKKMAEREIELTPWVIFSRIATCCMPGAMLQCCNSKLANAHVMQAWREKVTLCMIIFFICCLLAYLIFGVKPTMCPDNEVRTLYSYSTIPTDNKPAERNNYLDSVIIRGTMYSFEEMQPFLRTRNITMSPDFRSRDISPLFYDDSNSCSGLIAGNTTVCTMPNPYNNAPMVARPCIPISSLDRVQAKGRISFLWTDLDDRKRRDFDNLIVFDGKVFNVTDYLNTPVPFGSEMQNVLNRSLRKDASMMIMRTDSRKRYIDCLASRTEVGVLENTTMGCFASQTIMITALICVCMVVGIKFLMALTFNWFLSYRLTEKPRSFKSHKKEGSNDKSAYSAGANGSTGDKDAARQSKKGIRRKNLFTAMLVTCYSEGESSIRTTLNSLANTSYSVKHKLIVVICDGIVCGHGNKMTTPEIVISMIEQLPGSENPKASSYLAIADGEKQHNMAKVYGGHYVYKQKRVPIVVVVKCGNPMEKNASRPGNRGKRDSQLILMSFFQRVIFADRFTELDFEMFRKIRELMGVYPDRFELVLMVDADTMVKGDSLSYMVTAMQNDHTIMGLCGETMIANKTASWVTMIQVFEYYISHHLGKAFESVFGGVTCLPGCFCMYRIKAPKGDSWVPILANPEVIQEYNQNVVLTLHEKNLLLLGEDRYLTTLMLRTFPKRQMVFVPQAQCKTVVPDTFKVLLSQRRRWINSTIHNLLELVLVTDLCGIAFLSMQFVVFLELIGTVVLPAAILFTLGMITYASITQTLEVLPMILIVTIIGLPAVLIVLTTRQWMYVGWMLMYLISLPLWNFVLPLYSFWHFDDFSWGETRRVANMKRKGGQDHGEAEGEFESGSVVMRKWEEWEKDRLKKLGYRIQKRQSADHGINDLPPPAASMDDKVRKSQSTVNLIRSGGNGGQRQTIVGNMGGLISTLSLGSGMNESGGGEPAPPNRQRSTHRPPPPQSTGGVGGPPVGPLIPRPFSQIVQSTPNLLTHDGQQHHRPPMSPTIAFATMPRGGFHPPLRSGTQSSSGSRPLSHSLTMSHRPPPPHMMNRPLRENIEMGPMPQGAGSTPGPNASPMPSGFRPRPGPPPPGFRSPPSGHPGGGPMEGLPMMGGGPRPPMRPMFTGPVPPNSGGTYLPPNAPPGGPFMPLGIDPRMSQYSTQSAGVSNQGENNSTSGLLAENPSATEFNDSMRQSSLGMSSSGPSSVFTPTTLMNAVPGAPADSTRAPPPPT